MIRNGWKEFFIKPARSQLSSLSFCLFLLCLMEFSVIFVFLISLDSSLETHKAAKCFKKGNIPDISRTLSLVRWHNLWETTAFAFLHSLCGYYFCHMRQKCNTRTNQVIIIDTSQHHRVGIGWQVPCWPGIVADQLWSVHGFWVVSHACSMAGLPGHCGVRSSKSSFQSPLFSFLQNILFESPRCKTTGNSCSVGNRHMRGLRTLLFQIS